MVRLVRDVARQQRLCVVVATSALLLMAVALVAALNGLVGQHVPPVEIGVAIAVGSIALASLFEGAASVVRQARRHRRLVALLRATAVDQRGHVLVVEDPEPLAFCAGLLRPQVFVSTGAYDRLRPDQLAAVLDHEDHHAGRRDPLRALLGGALADALFYVPAARRLTDRHAALLDLAADAAATGRGRRGALAGAMLAVPAGVSSERVDRLLGDKARWGFSPAAVLTTVASLSLMAAGAGVLLDEAFVRFVLHQAPPEPLTALLSAGPLLCGAAGLCAARRIRPGTG